MASLRGALALWRARHISLFTRSFTCIAVSYPTLLYLARIIPFSEKTADAIHRTQNDSSCVQTTSP